MKTTIWEMKISLNGINGRLDITEENISELDIKTETIKNETQEEFLNTCIFIERQRARRRETETKRREINVSQIGKK